jgi:tetratricopeptide (TPR) repeat protein
VRRVLAIVLLAAGAASAQRSKPAYDPETKEGLLIEHILQEQDSDQRLRFMEQFAAQYPSHPAVNWVYDQLQPIYFKLKEYDQAIRIGALRLAANADNLDASNIALRSADAKHDIEQTIKWSDRVWTIASRVEAKGGAPAAEARDTRDYAEYCLYTAAMQTTDLRARLQLLENIEKRNPSPQVAHNLPGDYFRIYRDLGDSDKMLAAAETGLATEPDNFEMLMVLADSRFHKETPRDRDLVVAYTSKVVEVLEKKPRPETVPEAEWDKRKAQLLGSAYYMGGLSSSLNNNFQKADVMLRGALPYLKDKGVPEATALYHLGIADYRLAEKGDSKRAADALKYLRRCAAIRSPFQAQAAKYADGIKAEYNLP